MNRALLTLKPSRRRWALNSMRIIPQTARNCAGQFSILSPGEVSFKYGKREGERSGRFFNDYDEAKLIILLNKHSELRSQKVWLTRGFAVHQNRTHAGSMRF